MIDSAKYLSVCVFDNVYYCAGVVYMPKRMEYDNDQRAEQITFTQITRRRIVIQWTAVSQLMDWLRGAHSAHRPNKAAHCASPVCWPRRSRCGQKLNFYKQNEQCAHNLDFRFGLFLSVYSVVIAFNCMTINKQ